MPTQQNKGAIHHQWGPAPHILIVRLENLGDVLVTTPAIHAIKMYLPDAQITLMARPIGAQVAQVNNDIDDVIIYQAPWIDRTLSHDPHRDSEMVSLLKERRFDGVFIFTSFRQSCLATAFFCYLAGIPLRAGISPDRPGILLTTHCRPPQTLVHEVEYALHLLKAVGITTHESNLLLHIPLSAYEEARYMLSSYGRDWSTPLIILHPGSSSPARSYPWELYVQVIDGLVERFQAQVLITGSADELELVEKIKGHVQEKHLTSVFSLCDAVSFPVLCALIQVADITISNNTGPMHISAAVQTPVVALYAMTCSPVQWKPWNVDHRLLYQEVECCSCHKRRCPYHNKCLREVSPSQVIEATHQLLSLINR